MFGADFSHTIIHHGVISGGLMWEWDITALPAVELQKTVHTLQNLCCNEQKLSHRELKPFARGYEARKEQQLQQKLFHLLFQPSNFSSTLYQTRIQLKDEQWENLEFEWCKIKQRLILNISL